MATLLQSLEADPRELLGADELAQQIRSGLPYSAAETLMQVMGLSQVELASLLGVSERTLTRSKRAVRLNPIASDRLVRLARVALHGSDALGSGDALRHWLRTPNRALGGRAPLTLLDTDVGVRDVEAVFGRIDHGIFS
ncbi:MAG: type II RES/Xre toxin-antitoxin system antitoxin [Thermoanaerobaculia bacterium]